MVHIYALWEGEDMFMLDRAFFMPPLTPRCQSLLSLQWEFGGEGISGRGEWGGL